MGKLNSRITKLEQNSQTNTVTELTNMELIEQLGLPSDTTEKEMSEFVYKQMMHIDDDSEFVVNMPDDPIEASRMYVQVVRGEVAIKWRKRYDD